jgi:hypothetical protein
MASSNNIRFETQGATDVERGISEAMLRTEIRFWRDMIVSCRETEPADSIERMQHALALAELRLGHLCPERSSNVFQIETARGGVQEIGSDSD